MSPNGGQHKQNCPPPLPGSYEGDKAAEALHGSEAYFLVVFDEAGEAKLYTEGIALVHLPSLTEGVSFAMREAIVSFMKGGENNEEDPVDPDDAPAGDDTSTGGGSG